MRLDVLQTFDQKDVWTKRQKDIKDNKDKKDKKKTKKDIKQERTKEEDKRQRPKREFNIATPGQFRTLAMFISTI